MKTKLLILVITIGFISSANAQIKVFSNGKVGINKDSVTHDLEVFGNTYFNVDASYSWVGAMIDGSYQISGPGSFATLYSVNGMGVLGKPTAPWYYIYYSNLQQLSDSRIKKNVNNIESPLSGIKRLRPIKYDLNEKAFQDVPDSLKANLMEKNKDKFGFIAQELKEVYPTLVNYDKKSDLYSINYVELIPVLVGALNEQQSQIDSLKELISSNLPIKFNSA